MASPWSRYLAWRFTRCGISSLQGGHQVAQKSRITTFPLNEEDATWAPVRSGRLNSGAGVPTSPRDTGRSVLPPEVWPEVWPEGLAQDASAAARSPDKTSRAAPRRARATDCVPSAERTRL